MLNTPAHPSRRSRFPSSFRTEGTAAGRCFAKTNVHRAVGICHCGLAPILILGGRTLTEGFVRNAEDPAGLTCLHSSSNNDEVVELHTPSENQEAHPYRTIFSEGLYFRRMACRSMRQVKTSYVGRRPHYGKDGCKERIPLALAK